MRSSTHTALALAALLAACGATPAPQPPHAARPVVELARWRVFAGGEPIGVVVHLEIRDPQGPLPYYRIEDLHGRWVGHASQQGRFSRRVPFAEQEQDLGVWPMARGVAKLLDADVPVSLKPVVVEADARKK